MIRSLSSFLCLAVIAPASAQEFIHPDRVAILLSRERISGDADRVRALAARSADRSAFPADRVHAAHDRAEIEQSLQSDLSLGTQVSIEPEAGARLEWTRRTGIEWDAIDGLSRFRECLALARTEHVVSDDARDCAAHASHWDTIDLREVPWPLYVPQYRPGFGEDRLGSRSAALYRSVAEDLARHPRDRALRLALASMQIILRDHDVALRTLAPLGGDYDVRLARALADWGAGRREQAHAALTELVRADPRRPEAAFDLAQLLLGVRATEYPRPGSAVVLRALALYRLQICNSARAGPAPETIDWVAGVRADRMQFIIERPMNWSGSGSARPPVDGMPAPVIAHSRSLPPMMSCDRARSRALEIFAGPVAPQPRAPAPTLRPVSPQTASLIGPRPSFHWIGAGAVEIDLCADRACTNVRETLRASRSPFDLQRNLPSGRWFWRVRSGGRTSAVLVFWVAAHARGVQTIPDIDCDGWPDVPLGDSGWYAHFTSSAAPELVPLPGDESATALTFYAGDLDGDGCGDFAQIPGQGLVALYGSPSGPEPPRALPHGEISNILSAGDLDRDGLSDLLCDNHGALSLRHAGGRAPIDLAPRWLEPLGDVDGDGFSDLWTREMDTFEHRGNVGVVRAGPNGIEPPQMTIPISYDSERLFAVGDVDGDGHADAALLRTEGNPLRSHIELHRGKREGLSPVALGAPIAAPTDNWLDVIPVGDLDGDGFDDVVWRDRQTVSLGRGLRIGWSGRTIALGSWPLQDRPIAVHIPDAEPAVLWLLAPRSSRAIRVERGRSIEVQLAFP